MVVERGQLFSELERLTEKEIEARLDLWDEEQLALIQEYLDQKMLGRAQAEQSAWKTPGPSGAKTEQAAQTKAEPNAQDAVVASLLEVANTGQYQSHGCSYLLGRGNAGCGGFRAHSLSSSAGMDDVLVMERGISRLGRSRPSPHSGPS